MAFPTYPAGRVLGSRGMIPNQTDYKRFGSLPLQALYDGFLSIFYGQADGTPVDGFFGDSLTVEQVSGRDYQLLPGVGFQYYAGAGPASDEPRYRMIHVDEAVEFTVAAAPAGSDSRIDLIIVKADEEAVAESRDVKDLDASPSTVSPTSVDVMKRPSRGSASIYLQGEADASPVAPTVPAGYIAVARLDCAGDADLSTVTVTDLRAQLLRVVDFEPRLARRTGKILITADGWWGPIISGTDHSATLRKHSGSRTYIDSTSVGAAATYLCPLPMLPHGATIIGMAVTGTRAASGGTSEINIREVSRLGFKSDYSALDLTGSAGDFEVTDSPDVEVDLDANAYELRWVVSNPASAGDHDLWVVELEYEY